MEGPTEGGLGGTGTEGRVGMAGGRLGSLYSGEERSEAGLLSCLFCNTCSCWRKCSSTHIMVYWFITSFPHFQFSLLLCVVTQDLPGPRDLQSLLSRDLFCVGCVSRACPPS